VSGLDAALAAFASERHYVASSEELNGLGFSRRSVARRLEDGRLHRLHRGVFAVGRRPVSLRGRWRAAILSAGEGTWLSHLHGAALLDLTGPPFGPVHITVVGRWLRSQKGVKCHTTSSLAAIEQHEFDGIPVTSLPRTLLDVASLVDELTLRRMYERAERLEILDLKAIRRILRLRRGHRGAGRLRALIDYDPTAAADAVSELERLYLDLLRDAGLPTPQVNVLVDGHLVDCYWPSADLIVELDSYEFHGDREAFERDRAKIADLRRAGHEAVQFTYRQVTGRRNWVAQTTERFLGSNR
jgi:very-short-patch-repair endonuclease